MSNIILLILVDLWKCVRNHQSMNGASDQRPCCLVSVIFRCHRRYQRYLEGLCHRVPLNRRCKKKIGPLWLHSCLELETIIKCILIRNVEKCFQQKNLLFQQWLGILAPFFCSCSSFLSLIAAYFSSLTMTFLSNVQKTGFVMKVRVIDSSSLQSVHEQMLNEIVRYSVHSIGSSPHYHLQNPKPSKFHIFRHTAPNSSTLIAWTSTDL